VSREVSRHGGLPAYRAHEADEHAWDSALQPKQCLLALHPRLREMVASKLILDWSPEQISGWLKTEYPDDGSMHVSHETIYRSLFIQARGVLKKELMEHLRSKRRMRRSRHATVSGQSRGQIVDAISIRERPAEVDFTVATDVQVYFCDPQSPWQRGSNENTNLLLRQYFPRGTDLSGYSQAQLDLVALRLNQRPRKTLGFQTPASKLQASVASTV
jgi:IS30 family transposase